MELKELVDRTLEIFQTKDIAELGKNIKQVCENHDYEKMEQFVKLVNGDLTIDWVQKIFQYYVADRKDKKQDYTPKSLAKLVGRLSGESNENIDMCAGSGALTIQKWGMNPNSKFLLHELDENVIPYLLFNMMIRNIECIIMQADVLQNEVYAVYKIKKGNKFGEITGVEKWSH